MPDRTAGLHRTCTFQERRFVNDYPKEPLSAILRSVGARPGHVFGLVMGEAMFLTLLGAVLGMTLLYLLLFIGRPVIDSRFGIFIEIGGLSPYEWILPGAVVSAGFLVGSIPSYRAYRLSLADGMSVRV